MEKPTRPEPRWTDRLPRAAWLYAAGALLVALTVTLLFKPAPEEISYGELKRLLRPDDMGNRIAEFRGEWVLSPTQVSGELRRPDAAAFIDFVTPRLGIGEDDELIQLLDAAVADGALTYRGEREPSPLQALLPWLLPLAFMFAIFLLMMRRIGPGSAMPFARSRGRMYAQEDVGVTFHDVAGIDEAVDELREVVEFLKCPERYQSLGGRIPKGVLLVGPPGTGKTLLARAVAGEAGVPFFSLSGSDFVEMFVGVGAARVRDLFAQAVAKAPCIIFIDELDALGKSRGGSIVGGHDEREQTLNALLVEMDGFDSNRGVMILAATNRPETLDVALLRPGRFDRQVVVDRPDVKGREAILKVHARNVKLAADVEFRALASLTPGFAGADLANLVNEAALLAARKGKSEVGRAEFEEGIERVIAGLEKRQRVMHPEEKERVAHHECGHALVACSLPNTDPVHKVSIIPRGIGALGYTLQRPTDDRYLITRSELESRIRVLLGGHRRGGVGVRRDIDRRAERPGARQRDRAQHGARLRHERAPGAGELPRVAAAGLRGRNTRRRARAAV